MGQKTQTIETTPREQEIILSATSFLGKVGFAVMEGPLSWAETKAWCEMACEINPRRGATVYANGIGGGIEASCLFATYTRQKGWKFSDVVPEGFEP